eukprot:CAMPEP_0181252336 /NCGR_PEP_ID=MMETSP1096-20121128/47413_1 /TAXON_ID=156174 ORGANISM="Chrysochromulina ericina, Strain CCMP281" /NCGR_SAMPLE_ID=MMETSP1096 /ASSEMBLY_ACC=CAM_ASM_000453 /LENGTH=53 /DNA_ID=CAMNT_0023350093 /DNA_START=44 /DNA_END=202 /DNA_ORIENTATION=-
MSGERTRQPTRWLLMTPNSRSARPDQAKQRSSYASTAAIRSGESTPSAHVGQP